MVTTERRGHVFLIGLNRASAENRLNPLACGALARSYYTVDQAPDIRVAIPFGHGKRFCAGPGQSI